MLDSEKRKQIGELLSKGRTYRQIQKKLRVSSKDVANVSKEMKSQVDKRLEAQEYPSSLKNRITKLKAEKEIRELKYDIARTTTETVKLTSELTLQDDLILSIAEFLRDIDVLPLLLTEEGASEALQNALDNIWKRLLLMAKTRRPQLFAPLVARLIQALGISMADFVKNYLDIYGVTIDDLRKHNLIS